MHLVVNASEGVDDNLQPPTFASSVRAKKVRSNVAQLQAIPWLRQIKQEVYPLAFLATDLGHSFKSYGGAWADGPPRSSTIFIRW